VSRHEYLATALPALGEPGSRPPLGLAELADRLAGSTAEPLARAILLEEDLLLREACLAGEAGHPRPAILTTGQAEGRDPLPDFLAPEREPARRAVPGDAVWAAWCQHVAGLAVEQGSAFLRAWIAAEVGLRNGLAAARARSLGLDPDRFLVAPDLGEPRPPEDAVLAAWAAAPNPLAALQVVLRARWDWLVGRDAWFTFGDDELAAYAVRLTLLHRWHRVARSGPPGPARGGEGGTG
jgi:hypothetical protein